MEWKFLAVKPETKKILDELTGIGGKYRGYRKHELIKMGLDILAKV